MKAPETQDSGLSIWVPSAGFELRAAAAGRRQEPGVRLADLRWAQGGLCGVL